MQMKMDIRKKLYVYKLQINAQNRSDRLELVRYEK